MLTVYIDDSGTSPSQQVAIATALIIPARLIIRLENEWDRFAKKEGFTRFHTSEFVARNAKSEFANWDDKKQRRVFARVRQISMKYGVRAISIAVNKKDYDEIVPQDFKNYLGKEHYTWAARQTIAWVDTFFDGSKAAREWVFHWVEPHEPARGQVQEIMAQLDWVSRKRGLSFDYTNYSFRRDEKIPGLQCVDAISWVSYRFALRDILQNSTASACRSFLARVTGR